jgi:hypothetical protein
MRVCCGMLIVTFAAALAVAQISPAPKANALTDLPQHHRHEDDEQALPASAASVSPESPVITIEGVCDHPSDSGTPNDATKAEENAAAAKTASAVSASSACKTIVTKAQFEKLVDALNPQMTGMVRRQLAASYPRLLLFADKARALGLDQDPSFAERMRFASIQVLAQSLNRYFEQQANSVSDADVQEYYNANPIKFERADLMRILVPRQAREASKPASGGQADDTMLALAQKLRARATAGEDFQRLQKDAFEAAHISSGSPNVSMGKIAVTRLPVTQQKVFEMQPGQVSEVIIDSSGYYIYKMVSKELVPLSQTSKEIRKSIASQRVQDSVNSLTNSLKFDLNPMYFGTARTDTRAGQQADEAQKN